MLNNLLVNPTETLIILDIDKNIQEVTDRNLMPKDFLDAYKIFHDHTEGGLFIGTNSASEGIDTMMGGEQYPALVSQGTLCRYSKGGHYIPHPELNVSVESLVNEVAGTANDLITAYGYTATTNGTMLGTGQFLKPEHKQTCFCIVFDENDPQAKTAATEIIQKIRDSNPDIKNAFHVHHGRDAIELVPYDNKNMPFDKLKGIERIMLQSEHLDRNHLIISEDSNEDMLRTLHETCGAFNIATGSSLPTGDYIGQRVDGIHECRGAFVNAAKVLKETGMIDLTAFTPKTKQVQQSRRVRVV